MRFFNGTIWKSHKRTLLAIAFVFLYSASVSLATPPSTKYQPGETLNPDCAPGESNCSVQILPEQAGNAGKFLTSDGATATWNTIPNASLQHSSVTINGVPVSLGGSVDVISGTGFVKASGSTISYDNSTYLTTTGGYVSGATNASLARTGSGPYTLGLNLANSNTWSAVQYFDTGTTYNSAVSAYGFNVTNTATNKSSAVNATGIYVGASAGTGITISNSAVTYTAPQTVSFPDLSGTIAISAASLAGSGNRCAYVDSSGVIRAKGFDCGSATGGDNLGDHTATQNIQLNGNWLSDDGGSEGVQIDGSGNVSVKSAGGNPEINFLNTSGTATAQIKSREESSVEGGLSFYGRSAGLWERMILTSTGRLSVNDGASGFVPYGSIHIYGQAPTFYMEDFSTTGTLPRFRMASDAVSTTQRMTFSFSNGDATSTGDVPVMTLNQAGNVGIGTSTPGYPLSVQGGTNNGSPYRAVIATFRTNSYEQYLSITGDSSGTAGGMGLQYGIGTGVPEIFLTTGKVGIGTTSPYHKFEVAGLGSSIAFAPGDTSGQGNNAVLNSIVARSNTGALNATSSAEIKFLTGSDAWYKGQIAFYTNNIDATASAAVERMRINQAGNVGIGTTSPGQKLDVAGNINTSGSLLFADSAYVSGTSIRNNSNALIFSGGTSGYYFNKSDNTATHMYISGSGNVGIGTTSPIYPHSGVTTVAPLLQIQSSSSNIPALVLSSASAANSTYVGNIAFATTGTSAVDKRVATIAAGTTADSTTVPTGELTFWTNNAGSLTQKMVIDKAGNVGIGTTAPNLRSIPNTTFGTVLTLQTNTATARSTIELSGGNGSAVADRPIGQLDFMNGSNQIASILGMNASNSNATSGYIGLYTANAGTNSERMRIDMNGNVGIGTTSPDKKLHVAGDIHVGGVGSGIYFDTTGSVAGASIKMTDFAMTLSNNRGSGVNLVLDSGGTYINDAGGTRFYINPISGAVSITNLVSCGGVQTNGSGVMSCSSDETLKDKHGEFKTGLEAIREINPEAFSWKQGSGMYDGGIVYYGFIAQNVRDALPEAVSTSSTGKLQVSQLTLMAASINAIKELDIRVQALPEFEDPTMAAKVATFLEGIAHGIANIGTVNADKICVKKSNGENVCVTGDELDEVINGDGETNGDSYTPPAEDPSGDEEVPPSEGDGITPPEEPEAPAEEPDTPPEETPEPPADTPPAPEGE